MDQIPRELNSLEVMITTPIGPWVSYSFAFNSPKETLFTDNLTKHQK